jgi:TerC family integral membrane protein
MQVLAIWGFFAGLVVGTLMVGILRHMNKPHALSLREAAAWTVTWVGLAAMFGMAVFAFNGIDKGMEFVTGYLTEWSLSVGILFVFLMIFRYFRVPSRYLARVLFWGIAGAIVLRGIFIVGAASLTSYFAWLVYVFGAFLVYTGMKLLRQGGVHFEPRKDPDLRFFQRSIPVETAYDSKNFIAYRNGKLMAKTLVPVMIVVATTDIIFSAYSIPAILAITRDPFIVYTSNIYALLGLRALFFVLAGIMGLFRYLQAGVCAVLMFIGVEMLISEFVHIPIAISLGVVAVVLGGSVAASILFPAEKAPAPEEVSAGLTAPTRAAGEDAGEAEEENRAA